MSGALPSSQVETALQEMVRALYHNGTLLAALSATLVPPVSTVAALPASGDYLGQERYVSNGRNTGQGAAAGTGCPVFWNGSVWAAVWSGVQVLA